MTVRIWIQQKEKVSFYYDYAMNYYEVKRQIPIKIGESKTRQTERCGRVLVWLARAFPLCEKSGVNIKVTIFINYQGRIQS